MALNPASFTDATTLNINLSDPDSVSQYFREHFHDPPKAWMTIQGSHSATSQETVQLERVIDFDLKTKGLNARLLRVELRGIDGDGEVFSTGRDDQNSNMFDKETVDRYYQAIIKLVNTGSYKGYTKSYYF